MLISLKAKNFRKHRDLSLSMGSGLNVLRGPNEQGKTTIIEAFLYAFFGTAALRDSLADTVTWGCSEKDLWVEAILRVEGSLYKFTRSKAGAECNYEGGKVTGQKEVTSFAAELLGADAKTSQVLMMASQNGLRGALDDGPTAVSALISKLADFDLIDRVLENANSRLLLGSEQPFQDRLATALRDLETAKGAVPTDAERVISELRASVAVLSGEVETLAATESSTLHPAMLAAQDALEAARLANAQRQRVSDEIKSVQADVVQETGLMGKAELEMRDTPSPEALAAAAARLKDEQSHDARLRAYQTYQAQPAYPEMFWDGNYDSLLAEIDRVKTERSTVSTQVAEIRSAVKALQSQKITSGKCPTCGHAATSDEHVAEHNAGIDAKIAATLEPLAALDAKVRELGEDITALEAVKADGDRRSRAAQAFIGWAECDSNFVPWKLTWKGEPPQAESKLKEANQAVKELEAKGRAAAMAEGRFAAHKSRLQGLHDRLAVLVEQEKMMPVHDLAPLSAAFDEAYSRYAAHATVLRERRAVLDGERDRLNSLSVAVEAARNRVVEAKRRVVDVEDDLKKLAFNNGLVKKLKGLKPLISDHLWNTVLASVGTFFSQMRGEASVVTKDKDGFKVNGQKISSLSGSTLDVLALAIRVALVKTFIPHASFMTLDEPAHGCDMERTGNVLGFLAGVGFEQVLLASHDELSEAVADQVIALGA